MPVLVEKEEGVARREKGLHNRKNGWGGRDEEGMDVDFSTRAIQANYFAKREVAKTKEEARKGRK